MVTAKMEQQQPHPEMHIAPEVEIKPSEVDPERLGIWCKEKIVAGSKFGPFQGERVLEGTDDMDPSYVWEIVDLETKEFLCYINATDPKSGNWMRYINCARYFEEQNIVSEQEGIDIFYKAIKDIEPGEELLTWYEKSPFRKRQGAKRNTKKVGKASSTSTKTSRSGSPVSIAADVPESPGAAFLEDDMHTSQRGRRRKVTKYWEMENLENSENSDFQRESDINSEDDMTIASDDDWNASGPSFNKLMDVTQAVENAEAGANYFQFEVQPYHIVKSWLGRKVFKCEICSGVYRHSFSLKRHFIRNHINYKFVSKTDLLNCQITYNPEDEEKMMDNDVNDLEKENQCKSKMTADENSSDTKAASEESNTNDKENIDMSDDKEEKSKEILPKDNNANSVGVIEKSNVELPVKEDVTRETGKGDSRSSPTNSNDLDPDLMTPEEGQGDKATKSGLTSKNKKTAPSLVGVKMQGLYRCNVCEKLYDTVYDLKEHLSNHPESSSKAFACDKCDMKFTHKQNLMRHTAVHTGARPFICKYCGKKFPTITNQKRHERIHQGRRFSCDHCSSTFSQTGDLKKHVRKLHPELFHECGFCAKYYATKELLTEHLKASHGEDFDANTNQISIRKEAFKVDLESDRAESMRLAVQKGVATSNKPQFRFACTVCKKKFVDYANMCRHRRLAHQRHILHVVKRDNDRNHAQSPLKALFDPDMDKNSAFYAKVSKNIADNLKYHVEGKQEDIKHGANFIRWKGTEEEEEAELPSDGKPDKLENYNFPQGYLIKDSTKLFSEKVRMMDYVQSSGLADIEKARAVIRELPSTNVEDNEPGNSGTESLSVEVKNESVPPTLSLCSDSVDSLAPPSISPNLQSPSKPLTIKVPDMKLCKVCHCVFHNADVFQDHMLHKHRMVVAKAPTATQSPPPAPVVMATPMAHQHHMPLTVLPPPLLPGMNPNKTRSLLLNPHIAPPPAHQPPKQLSPSPPKLSPMLPTDPPPPAPKQTTPTPTQNSPQIPSEQSPKPSAPLKDNPAKFTKTQKEEDDDPSKKVTGEDPNPRPCKYVCLVCYNEYKDVNDLELHQEEKHRTVQCKSVAVDLSFTTSWLTNPSPVGMLNVSTCQIPEKTENGTVQRYMCTKCHKSFANASDLHVHILDCGDYGRNAPPLAYIWYLRGQVITPKKPKKTGHGKFRRGRNTVSPQKKKSTDSTLKGNEMSKEDAQLLAQRRILERQLSQDSPDDELEFGRRRRRRIQELSYNPHNHVRRRDLAALLGNKCLGCGETFEIISMLERHIPMCPDKEKIRGTSLAVLKPQAEEALDSEDDFDPSKHMCIYCEKQFTYLGKLRQHIQDVCTIRRELVEKDEYIDEEWELDIDIKTGHATGKRTLSRQSSMSSLNGTLAEEAENSQDSFDRPRRRRRRRGHNWGYKPKGSKRRPEDEGTPYMIEHSFFADIGDNDSSTSRVASLMEDESSNDSSAMALGTTAADLQQEGSPDVGALSAVKSEEISPENVKPFDKIEESSKDSGKSGLKRKKDKGPVEGVKEPASKKKKVEDVKTDVASQEIKEKLAKKIKESTKKPKQKAAPDAEEKIGKDPADKTTTKAKTGNTVKKPLSKKNEEDAKSKAVTKQESNLTSMKLKLSNQDENKKSKAKAFKVKQPEEKEVKTGKAEVNKVKADEDESDDEDEMTLSDLKGSFSNDVGQDEAAAGAVEQDEYGVDEKDEEEVEESVPKKRRRRGPRLTMKKKKSTFYVPVFVTPPLADAEDGDAVIDRVADEMKVDNDETLSSRDISPNTRLQSRMQRDISPASSKMETASEKRDVSPFSKAAKRKKKLVEEESNGEEEEEPQDVPKDSKVPNTKGKKGQKTFHTRSKSVPGFEVTKMAPKVKDISSGKTKSGRKSDSSLAGAVQSKPVGKGTGNKKSAG